MSEENLKIEGHADGYDAASSDEYDGHLLTTDNEIQAQAEKRGNIGVTEGWWTEQEVPFYSDAFIKGYWQYIYELHRGEEA